MPMDSNERTLLENILSEQRHTQTLVAVMDERLKIVERHTRRIFESNGESHDSQLYNHLHRLIVLEDFVKQENPLSWKERLVSLEKWRDVINTRWWQLFVLILIPVVSAVVTAFIAFQSKGVIVEKILPPH